MQSAEAWDHPTRCNQDSCPQKTAKCLHWESMFAPESRTASRHIPGTHPPRSIVYCLSIRSPCYYMPIGITLPPTIVPGVGIAVGRLQPVHFVVGGHRGCACRGHSTWSSKQRKVKTGWEAGIRTPIRGSRGRSLTVRRPPSTGDAASDQRSPHTAFSRLSGKQATVVKFCNQAPRCAMPR